MNPRTIRTRSTILDTAWKLIADRGLDVRMTDIADAVGMTRQSIYFHSKSRGGLLIALVRRADDREEIHDRLSVALGIEDPAVRFSAFLHAWFDFVPTIYPVARQLIAARAQDIEVDEAWSDRMNELHGGFLLLARSLRRDGALSAQWTAPTAADYLWASTSVQAWELLAIDRGWGPHKAEKLLLRSLTDTLLR